MREDERARASAIARDGRGGNGRGSGIETVRRAPSLERWARETRERREAREAREGRRRYAGWIGGRRGGEVVL